MMVHRTPLFYPLNDMMIGFASERVYAGGFFYYVTDPIFLFEPFLFLLAAYHWIFTRTENGRHRHFWLGGVSAFFVLGSLAFLLMLPRLQSLLPV
jgi:hypothetical protein